MIGWRLQLHAAWKALFWHPTRTLLTMMGITIGIASILCTLSIGRGSEKKLYAQVMALGNNHIMVYTKHRTDAGKLHVQHVPAHPITVQECIQLQADCPYPIEISPGKDAQAHAHYHSHIVSCRLRSGWPEMTRMLGRSLDQGTSFNHKDRFLSRKVVILGARAKQELFGPAQALNKTIYIKQIPYTVIGVLKPVRQWWGEENPNFDIFVPFTTALHYVFPKQAHDLQYLIITTDTHNHLEPLTDFITTFLRQSHNLGNNAPNDFTLWNQKQVIRNAQKTTATMHLFVLIAAGVALLIAGIGVMNIMLVSTQERRREIGVLRAIGARRVDIVHQFILESILLCLCGGMMGIIIALAILLALAYCSSIPIAIEGATIMLCSSIPIIIGLLFGTYPAYRISRLSARQALEEW